MRMPLLEVCQTRYLLTDGGISVALHRLSGEVSIPAEHLSESHPQLILDLYDQFLDAGADCITTNTFSANATRLKNTGSADCVQLCQESARLARQAAGPDRYVLGSVGPWYETAENWQEALAHQIRSIADGGVDVIYLETVSSLEAARELTRIAKEEAGGLPVILSFVFKKTGNEKFELSGDGASLSTVAQALPSFMCDAYGINCGHGLDVFDYSTLVSAFRAETGKAIFARPSAGDPRDPAAKFPQYPDSPEYMGEAIWGLVRSGASVIGGCCGVTPEHVRAFRNELDMLG